MSTLDRERRHDERWQAEVLDAFARTLDVLHDISDAVRDGTRRAEQAARDSVSTGAARDDDDRPALLSVAQLADNLGVSPGAIRNLRAAGHAPTATKIGTRILFHRDDVAAWLQRQREDDSVATAPWRSSYLPGRIGAGIPRSSEPQPWCAGSHTEPLAASRYSGRALCRVCRDDVLVNRDGRIRKHRQF